MIHIKVLIRTAVIAEHEFDQPRVTIGRTPDNDVQLENLALSRRHAEIVRVGGGWRLRDLGSRNGLHVNGARRTLHDLDDGDLVVLGKYTLAVSLPEQARPPDPALEELLALGQTVKVDEDGPPVPPGEGEGPRSAWLAVTRGGSGLYRLQRDAFLVGSAAGCELRLTGLLAPARLAMIVRGKSGWSLVNLSRRGDGVQRNGEPIRLRTWLEDGDRLEMGDLSVRFRLAQREVAS